MRRTTSSSGPNWRAGCTPPSPAPAGAPNSSMPRRSATTAIRCFRAGYRSGRRWSMASCATQNLGRAISLRRRRHRHYRHRRGCATRAARDLRIISPPGRTGPLPSRRGERALSRGGPAIGARSGGSSARRPAPNTHPIARYTRSTSSSQQTANAVALNAIRLQACRSGVRHDEAVELVGHLDLARQARVRPHVEAEIQHVLFHRRRARRSSRARPRRHRRGRSRRRRRRRIRPRCPEWRCGSRLPSRSRRSRLQWFVFRRYGRQSGFWP